MVCHVQVTKVFSKVCEWNGVGCKGAKTEPSAMGGISEPDF